MYVAIVTKLLSSHFGAHLVESYCKESNIFYTNWLRCLSSSYLIKIWLSEWHNHLANLHILNTWISLEQKGHFKIVDNVYSFQMSSFVSFLQISSANMGASTCILEAGKIFD